MVAGGSVDASIDRHPRDRVRMAVAKEGQGRDAITHYRVRDRFRAHTVLECRLETGRTHQIRVHMAYIKHPLIGDPLYGGAFRLPKAASGHLIETLRSFKRQALHAEKLSFTHPVSQEPMAFESPLPTDMVELIEALRDDTRQFNAA
jgi:23S rRNA pseudouridine1911/1915/1917 synthase